MRQSSLRMVAALVAGLVLGAGVFAGVWAATRATSDSAAVRPTLGEKDREYVLEILSGWRDAGKTNVLVRSNAYAALANAAVEFSDAPAAPASQLVRVAAGETPYFTFTLMYLGERPSEMVAFCLTESNQLVHFSQPVDWGWTEGILHPSVPCVYVDPSELAEAGEIGEDGVIYVTNKDLKTDPKKVPLPSGKATMGFRFADGRYTNTMLFRSNAELFDREEVGP